MNNLKSLVILAGALLENFLRGVSDLRLPSNFEEVVEFEEVVGPFRIYREYEGVAFEIFCDPALSK